MTVDWQRVETALVSFLEATAVVKEGHVFWEREANPIAYDDVVQVRILSERSLGYDDVEDVLVAPNTYAPRITGLREFTLSIRLHSRSHKTAARWGLERIRACLQHPRLAQILEDAGIAFLSTEPLMTLDALYEQRWESVVELDARFGVLSELFEPDTDQSADPLVSVGVTVQGQTLSIPE